MELRIIYRFLRKISDWTLVEFYSEVEVDGVENVPKDGPLILTSSHHNEMIDIATLAAMIPYRRHVSFWAKSSMFDNPVSRFIMTSANAIPVRRNPNRINSNSPSPAGSVSPSGAGSVNGSLNAQALSGSSSTTTDLFRDSCIALSSGQVIGIFPEGTSYTQPHIMQIKEGAARVAVEYAKWICSPAAKKLDLPLVIVPVGIVYTDKSKYQSRISVKYGEPISLADYKDEILSSRDNSSFSMAAQAETQKGVVKKIMAEVHTKLTELTVNAPDWDTLYAAQTARGILWNDEDISLRDFTRVSQTLVDILAPTSPLCSPLVKDSLIKYFSLLHYTSISQSSLNHLLPISAQSISNAGKTSTIDPHLTKRKAFVIFIRAFSTLFLNPHFILFIPPMMVHIPAYILGSLSVKLLATKGEEEGPAQFKSIFGGVGIGAGCAGVAWVAIRRIARIGRRDGDANEVLKMMQRVVVGAEGRMKKWCTVFGLMYGVGWLMTRWHRALIRVNYQRWKNLMASCKLLLDTVFFSPSSKNLLSVLSPASLAFYTRPPPPPKNIFIKSSSSSYPFSPSQSQSPSLNRSLSSFPVEPKVRLVSLKLVNELLSARMDASKALASYLGLREVRAVFEEKKVPKPSNLKIL